MKSKRGILESGSLYKLFGHDDYVLECIDMVAGDPYSMFTARVRSVVTGWTMIIHGVNVYEDGSIDWDFSTGGMWTEKDKNGVLHQRKM